MTNPIIMLDPARYLIPAMAGSTPIILRLGGVIDWNWGYVMLPIVIMFFVHIFLVVLFCFLHSRLSPEDRSLEAMNMSAGVVGAELEEEEAQQMLHKMKQYQRDYGEER